MPQQALETIPKIPTQPMQLFDGSRIFFHAPQYQWHTQGAKELATIDEEAREHIISINGLLDHFGHRTKQREELLWARAKEVATRNQVARLVEPLDHWIFDLE